MTSTYEQQAIDFLQKTNTTLTFEFSHVENQRFVYKWILKKGSREAKGEFTQSLNETHRYIFGMDYPIGRKTIYQEQQFNDKLNKAVKFADARAKLGKPIPSPSAYDLLVCLTKEDPGDVNQFAEAFGYNHPSDAIRIHGLCKNEYQQLCSLFNEEEMDELREIQ